MASSLAFLERSMLPTLVQRSPTMPRKRPRKPRRMAVIMRARQPWTYPERASMDGKSQQLETPRESVAQLYHRFSKMVLVVMTLPWTVDTLQ